MYTFDIIIENLQKRITQLHALHIMAGLLVLVYGLRGFSDLPKTSMQLYTGIPLAIAILGISIFKKNNLLQIETNRLFRILEAAFVTMGALHFFKYHFTITGIGFAISAILLLFMLMIENQVLGGYQIAIADNGVTTNNGFRKKIIPWIEIQNVIAKDGILTVDMKNNYLMQSKYSNILNNEELAIFNNWSNSKLSK
jgi:hypothetical protein